MYVQQCKRTRELVLKVLNQLLVLALEHTNLSRIVAAHEAFLQIAVGIGVLDQFVLLSVRSVDRIAKAQQSIRTASQREEQG